MPPATRRRPPGLKLNEQIEKGEFTADEAVMGYVGAYPYAEVISGYTAFYLGARSVCPSVTMKVQYTNSWADMAMEQEAASALISQGCKLISQHADTTGAPTACQAPYYNYAVNCLLNGEEIATDWCKGFSEGATEIKELNEKVVAAGTAEKVAEVEAALKDGTLHVFDCSTFTVDGKTLTDADSQYIWDGYFHESELASAPSFDFIIDGISIN